MKAWCWLGIAALVVLLALGASGVVHGPLDPGQPHQDLCAQGDALRLARLLDKAEETYAKAGGKCPQLADVELTQGEADELFAVGNVYALAAPAPPDEPKPGEAEPSEAERQAAEENSEKAIDSFARGLALDPFDESASIALGLELKKGLVDAGVRCETAANLVDDGLLGLAGTALAAGLVQKDELCETTVAALGAKRTKAFAYLFESGRLGEEGAVRTAFAKALRENANLTAAQTDLEGSLNDESRLDEVGSWLRGIPGTLETALKWFVPLLVGLVLLALLAWIGIRESAARWSWLRCRFQKLGEHPGLSFLYKAAVPDIEIKPFGGKGEADLEGAGFSTLLGPEISRPLGREPAFPFDRVTTGIEPNAKDNVTVVDLLTEIPATKLLGSVFSVLSKLFRRRRILLTGHLTPLAGKGAGIFLSVEGNDSRLNECTTLWERSYDPEPGGKGAGRWLRLIPAASVWARWHLANAQDPTKCLDVAPWKVDALFQSGQAWQLEGDRARAETLYTEALEHEPGLLPAAHNLSVLEVRRHRYRQAAERIEGLRAILESGDAGGLSAAEMTAQWPTLDTASLYTLMLAYAYPRIDPEANAEDGDLGKATAAGRQLVETLTGQLEAATEANLKEQLELAEPAAVVVLASVAIRKASGEGKKEAVRQATEPRRRPVDRLTRKQLHDSVGTLKPWDLIHRYAEVQPNVSRRAHYNLACYYTTLSEYAEGAQQTKCRLRAMENLEAALVGDGGLVSWADRDPSLEPLKQACAKKFQEVLAEHTVESHEPEEPADDEDKKSPADEERRSIVALLNQIRDEMRKWANQ